MFWKEPSLEKEDAKKQLLFKVNAVVIGFCLNKSFVKVGSSLLPKTRCETGQEVSFSWRWWRDQTSEISVDFNWICQIQLSLSEICFRPSLWTLKHFIPCNEVQKMFVPVFACLIAYSWSKIQLRSPEKQFNWCFYDETQPNKTQNEPLMYSSFYYTTKYWCHGLLGHLMEPSCSYRN